MIPIRFGPLGGLVAAAAVALLLLGGCEQIDPKVQGPSLAEGAELLSCEGCHTNRSFLRRLALEVESTGSGGG